MVGLQDCGRQGSSLMGESGSSPDVETTREMDTCVVCCVGAHVCGCSVRLLSELLLTITCLSHRLAPTPTSASSNAYTAHTPALQRLVLVTVQPRSSLARLRAVAVQLSCMELM